MGRRPRSDEPTAERVTVRLTPRETASVDALRDALALTGRAEVLRMGAEALADCEILAARLVELVGCTRAHELVDEATGA